ncbi:MAG: hypothetical protein ACHQUC_02060 [Chlamydiales bacterium]
MLSIRSTDPQSPDFLVQEENQRVPIQAKIDRELPSPNPTQNQVEEEEVSPGLLQKFLNSLGLSKKNEKSVATDPIKNINQVDPIGYAPVLDPPANMDPQLKNFKLSKQAESTSRLSDEQIFDGLSQISNKTISEIMMIVLKAQSELEREGMILDLDTMDKFQKLQALRQKVLQKIKLALQEDEKLLSRFKTAQDIAFFVGTGATLFAMIASSGILTVLAALAAVGGGISAAGKSYASVRKSENDALFIRTDHERRVTQGHMEETSHRMERAMQSKTDKLFSELLRNMVEIARMINSK